ncbi:UNVERIFIED_ORG: hypothetical protein ABIB19_001455 [Arthrobacter sp. UYEF10]
MLERASLVTKEKSSMEEGMREAAGQIDALLAQHARA